MRAGRFGFQALVMFSSLALAAQAFANEAAHGAEGEPKKDIIAHELQLGPLIVTIIIFVALVLVLGKFAWKPILKGLQAREAAIRTSIEAATKAKADAEKATREMEERLATAQREAAMQLQQAKADAVKLADAIKAQAEAESAAMKDRALRDIEAAKQQALSEINTRAADVGVSVARKILRREVTANDQSRLVEESLAELGTTKI